MGGKNNKKIDKRLKELEKIMSDYYRKLGKYELEYQGLVNELVKKMAEKKLEDIKKDVIK
jgi:hypothetical protein